MAATARFRTPFSVPVAIPVYSEVLTAQATLVRLDKALSYLWLWEPDYQVVLAEPARVQVVPVPALRLLGLKF